MQFGYKTKQTGYQQEYHPRTSRVGNTPGSPNSVKTPHGHRGDYQCDYKHQPFDPGKDVSVKWRAAVEMGRDAAPLLQAYQANFTEQSQTEDEGEPVVA